MSQSSVPDPPMSPPLALARSPAEVRALVARWRATGARVGLVPTMGALHEGHLDLVRAAKAHCDRVLASIFVNPAQFAPHEDLARYPRQEAADLAILAGAGCDAAYLPEATAIYPPGFATIVRVEGVSAPLEGEFRPHFFQGVATVVAKLLVQVAPDLAAFGEKDWQQLQVVTRMVADLDLPVTVLPVPTRREPDGLALSSRNAYLSAAERAAAPALQRALGELLAAARAGDDTAAAQARGVAGLLAAGFRQVDYLSARHAATLEPWAGVGPVRVLGAAWIGATRLIDNLGDNLGDDLGDDLGDARSTGL